MNATLPSGFSRRAFALTFAIAALSAATLLATAQAQTTGDPATGKLLYDDTPGQTGNQMLTGACNTCHSVLDRRNRISNGGGDFAAVGVETARLRLIAAISGVPQMGQFSFLSDAEIRNLASYIADTPKTSYDTLDFAPSAVNVAQSLPLDLNNAVTNSTTNLGGGRVAVTGVAIVGANAGDFSLTSDACTSQMLALGGTCRVTVRFASATTAARTATLRFTLDPEFPTTTPNYTRDVALTGVAAGAAPAPAPAPGGDDGGGGALGAGWLAALAAAAAAAAATRRRRG